MGAHHFTRRVVEKTPYFPCFVPIWFQNKSGKPLSADPLLKVCKSARILNKKATLCLVPAWLALRERRGEREREREREKNKKKKTQKNKKNRREREREEEGEKTERYRERERERKKRREREREKKKERRGEREREREREKKKKRERERGEREREREEREERERERERIEEGERRGERRLLWEMNEKERAVPKKFKIWNPGHLLQDWRGPNPQKCQGECWGERREKGHCWGDCREQCCEAVLFGKGAKRHYS